MDQSEESQQQQEQQERVLENVSEVTYSLPQFNHGPGVETGMPAVPVSSPTQQPPGSTSQQEQEQLQLQQLPYPQPQQFYQQQQGQQQNQLQEFWDYQMQEVEEMTDFRNHSLPLARIKKIMKADEDVRMISSEAPVLFAKACEMFILELTFRSWLHTEENKRRTLQKNDIAAAISRTDLFDFLVDIIPRDEIKEEALSVARANIPLMGAPGDVPYYYVPQQHAMGQGGLYPDQQPHPALPYMPWQQPQQNQQPQQYEDQPQQNGN